MLIAPAIVALDCSRRITGTGSALTVTLHLADLSPAFAVMTAVPSLIPFTVPFLTVATAVLEEVQVTVLSVALSGLTVAVRVSSPFTFSVRLVLFRVTDVTATTALETVTLHVAVLSPAFAVIVAVPALMPFTFPSLTVATAVSEEDQVTVLSVALSGLTVAVRVSSLPSAKDKEVLSKEMDVTATTPFLTVTLHVAVLSSAFAVMVAVPALIPFTFPSLTVAMDVLEEVQVTVLSVALSGLTVAERVSSSPSVKVMEVLSKEMEVTATSPFLTVTLHVAVLSPAFAVMVAIPTLMPFTFPLSTVAMDVLEEVQVTVWSVALSGLTVAVRVISSFTVIVNEVLSKEMDVTAIKAFLTVTLHVAVLSPVFAVMTDVPSLTAVTFPSFTVATSVFSEVQVTVLSVASSGLTVAVREISSPSVISREVLSRVTDVTAMNFACTFTAQVAVLFPALAVMVAVPSFTAVTTPSLTVATAELDELQVTVLSVALPGLTVALILDVSPSSRVREVGFTEMDATGIVSASCGLQENRTDSSVTPKKRVRGFFFIRSKMNSNLM